MIGVAFTNLGCRVNRVEIDAIARELSDAGLHIVDAADANIIVINTCAVTGEAEAKARKAVRHAANLPQAPWVVATGCVASLFADELSQLGESVIVEPVKKNVAERVIALSKESVDDAVFPRKDGSADRSAVCFDSSAVCKQTAGAAELASLALRSNSPRADHASLPRKIFAWETQSSSADTLPDKKSFITPTGRMRPGIKIQDGCDNRCTYCIVWKARGKATSISSADVISGVNNLVADGAKEVVLTGIDLGRYDADGLDLTGLTKLILQETTIERVRISSVEPAGVTQELLEVIATSSGRVAPFLHIPLQSGCDATLKRMARPYSVAQYLKVIEAARAVVPDIALACDLIVGFPGETDDEFFESLQTCEDIAFANMHVFRYSKRPGTPAASMPNQVSPELSAMRSKQMRACAIASRKAFIASLVGKPQQVLVEQKGLGSTGGLVEALVDDGLMGQMCTLTAHGVTREGLLDMRSNSVK